MSRCEGAWKQVLWLWERSWPDVDGMGEEDEVANAERFGTAARGRTSTQGGATAAGPAGGGGPSDRDGEIDDDVIEVGRRESGIGESPSYVSPYGGTGLQAVEAANHA